MIVKKIEDGMNIDEVEATTYQMRNFYQQLGGAYFSVLDTMNYIQHHQIVKWSKPDYDLLDVCCGRGLLLPMLRYQVPNLGSYTGVDIEPKNAIFTKKRVTDNKPVEDNYYPFPVSYIECNVREMSFNKQFDIIVYTSSIEHMHKYDGQKSLEECNKLLKDNGKMILTCPVGDGINNQYSVHIHEWSYEELVKGLDEANFEIVDKWGLLLNKRELREECIKIGIPFDRMSKFIPLEWLIPVLSSLFTEKAKEIGFICRRKQLF